MWLRLLKAERGISSPTFALFASPGIGAVAQTFAEERALSVKYSRVAKLLGTLLAAAKFAHAMLQAKAAPETAVSTAPIDQITALHTQALSETRQQSKFDVAQPPKAWLDWAACNRARLRAEQAVEADEGAREAESLTLVRDCCLLRLLTGMPPE